MRTDSVNLSQDAVNAAKQEIIKDYWEKYSNPTAYKTKSAWAQEAHECIRPAHLEVRNAWDDPSQKKLYDLIWKRTIASQMAPASIEKTIVTIDISWAKSKFVAEWEVITFDGFLKVYSEWTDDDETSDTVLLPKLEKWEILDMSKIVSTEKFKKHPPRYTEASLVKELEKRWIWRPSTYASIITKIQDRKYVVKEDREWEKRDYTEITLENWDISEKTKNQNSWAEKWKLFPTQAWRDVTDFLMKNFENIMDYNFTASVETDFDEIAEWKIEWIKMMHQFYGPFHDEVVKAQGVDRIISEIVLWEDPESKKPVIARTGKFWPFVQIWNSDDPDKKYANLPSDKSLETITLEEALQCFSLPREVGEYKWEKIIAALWRFWPYLKYKNIYASIPKNPGESLDPHTITLEQAIPIVEKKLEFENNKNINQFEYEWEKIEVLNGPYGPYVKYNKKNYKIPKWWKDATSLELEDCLSIIWIKANSWKWTKKNANSKTTKKKATTKKK